MKLCILNYIFKNFFVQLPVDFKIFLKFYLIFSPFQGHAEKPHIPSHQQEAVTCNYEELIAFCIHDTMNIFILL